MAPVRRDKANPQGKRALPADLTIGRNIRALRLARRLSQTALADHLGVSFQQVQKYERGSNRIGAGRLAQVAARLDVPLSALYAGAAETGTRRALPPPITDGQTLRAANGFAAIGDAVLRRALIQVIERAAALMPAKGEA